MFPVESTYQIKREAIEVVGEIHCSVSTAIRKRRLAAVKTVICQFYTLLFYLKMIFRVNLAFLPLPTFLSMQE